MKKKVFSVVLILVGAGLWWSLANTARFSIKKWDAKFESVLRQSLSDVGLSDKNLLSSVHQISKDDRGEWVTHRISLREVSQKDIKALKNTLKKSGAQIEEMVDQKDRLLLVKRGSRVYQEIRIPNIK